MSLGIALAENGVLPESLMRIGIRNLLRQRLKDERRQWEPARDAAMQRWLKSMREAPIALVPEKANEQHYEVPPEFFVACLGPRLKYSSCWYERGNETLAEAEEAMLAKTCERADLRDGQRVLELGCGWGSLSLWMAEHYPKSQILGVSNSAPQREFIMARARARGLRNLEIRTCDMNGFEPGELFDRVVSVEMFEHMRNWEQLFTRVSGWMKADARLFLHVFAHKRYAYPFEDREANDWMSRYFFTGGMMPSHDLPAQLESPLKVEQSWEVNGRHYAQTSEHWLENLERSRDSLMPVLERTYGKAEARRWYHRWRLFYLACAELFGYDNGNEWIVSHHRLAKRGSSA
jgi:cyclopropane-fatty-acyl-phospholipid synthase